MMRELLDRARPRTLYLVVGSLLLVVTTALLTYLVGPQLKSYRSAQASRDVLTNLVSGRDDLVAQLAAQQQVVSSLEHRLHGDMTHLPPRQMQSYIIGRLQKICWLTEMDLVSVKPGRGQDIEMFREIQFQVELAGRYFAFFDWLRAVTDELGFVVIKQYEIQRTGRDRQEPQLTIHLTMVSYRAQPS